MIDGETGIENPLINKINKKKKVYDKMLKPGEIIIIKIIIKMNWNLLKLMEQKIIFILNVQHIFAKVSEK